MCALVPIFELFGHNIEAPSTPPAHLRLRKGQAVPA
jgi:hypothetical protein